MKKEEQKKNVLKEMWNTEKGKALLKLGMWFLFFCVIGILLLFSSSDQNLEPESKEPSSTKENAEWINIDTMLETLMQSDYKYQISIESMEGSEPIIYNGERKDGIDTGYRESKIGIIKYKIVDGKTFQVLVDEDIEIDNLFQEEDQNYVNIWNVKEQIQNQNLEETRSDGERTLLYHLEDATIEITTEKENINTIKSIANRKQYLIKITEREELDEKEKNRN